MQRVFSLILLLSSTLFVLATSEPRSRSQNGQAFDISSEINVEQNIQISDAQQLIESLQAQLQQLTPTEPLGSSSAANVRKICSTDYTTYCKLNTKNTPTSNLHHQMHHDHHQDHHGKMSVHHRFLSEQQEHHSNCHHAPLLVFGSFENDMCMVSNFDQLSVACQEAIKTQVQLNEQKTMEFSNSPNGVHGGGLIFLIVLIPLICLCKRCHHGKKMRKFVDVIYENPEIRSVVEGIAGESLPPRSRCCAMSECKKKFLRFVFFTWVISSSIVAVVFLVIGVPLVTVVKVILFSLIGILGIIWTGCILKKIFCCFRRLCCSNCCCSSSSSSSYVNRSVQSTNHYQMVPNADQFDSNDFLLAADQFNNGNVLMVYSGLPVAPPNQTSL